MKVYSGTEMNEINSLHRTAVELPKVAIRLRDVVRESLKDGPARAFDVYFVEHYAETDIMLDFRLTTGYGQVYCRFDVVSDDNHHLGKYTFFYQTRDDENIARQVRVFALLFDLSHKYVFGDVWMMDTPDDNTIGGDFAYYLIGNILANVAEQLPRFTNSARDIRTFRQNL